MTTSSRLILEGGFDGSVTEFIAERFREPGGKIARLVRQSQIHGPPLITSSCPMMRERRRRPHGRAEISVQRAVRRTSPCTVSRRLVSDVACLAHGRAKISLSERMAAEWEFLVALTKQLRPLTDPAEIQDVSVRRVGEHLRANRVNYAYIDGDEFVISRSYADGLPGFTGRGPLAQFGKAIVDSCRRGEMSAINDVLTDPRF